ncbi:MAG: alpha/beta fold hydrolase [Clostridia bacterium]|nr:alpha/beta fold hydrolase [Clostridia bacterium]
MKIGLLLIHGFLTGTDDWDAMLPELQSYYDGVELFCQPGHVDDGKKPNYKEFRRDRCYELLAQTVKEMEEKYDTFDVIGHSMGGGMAIVASTSPKVRKAFFIAPAIFYLRPGVFSRKNLMARKLAKKSEKCADVLLAEKLKNSSDNILRSFTASFKLFRRRLFPHWSPHTLLTFASIMKRARKYVSKVTCPVTVFWGKLDEFVPRRASNYLIKKVSSADKTLITYDNIGHGILYKGNNTLLIRDLKQVIGGDDACDVTGVGEMRTVKHYKMTDGAWKITFLRSKLVKENGKIIEKTTRTEKIENKNQKIT